MFLTERKCCVTHFNIKNIPSINMIKSLVYRFKLVAQKQTTHRTYVVKVFALRQQRKLFLL